MSKIQSEIKKEFHLERVLLFSDAVFAIAITLLVIDLKIPHLEGAISDKEILASMYPLAFKFIGFLISFFYIALYWTVHHKMFTYVENYDPTLLWLNLFFLFTIVLMPFSSGMYGEYSADIWLIVPYAIYVGNICLLSFANYILWKYIANPKHKIANKDLTPEIYEFGMRRNLIAPAIFFLSLLVTLLAPVSIWFPFAARFFPMFIPLAMKIFGKKITLPESS